MTVAENEPSPAINPTNHWGSKIVVVIDNSGRTIAFTLGKAATEGPGSFSESPLLVEARILIISSIPSFVKCLFPNLP